MSGARAVTGTSGRMTRQKAAIWHVLEASSRPLGPSEVLALTRRRVPGIGIATVYRFLNRLLEEGRLVPVEIPGQPRRYERAGLAHHHHFFCNNCSRVYELDGCGLRDPHPAPKGFEVESHEVILYGTCAACR